MTEGNENSYPQLEKMRRHWGEWRGHKSYSFEITLFLFNLQAQKLYGSVPEYTYLFAKKKKQTLFNVSIKIGIDIYTL